VTTTTGTTTVTTTVAIDPFPVAALAALFDNGLGTPGPGEPLPPYWHLAACAVPLPTTALGPDGHPVGGQVVAPPGLPRRMAAGGKLRIHRPVRVGERLSRRSRITGSADKHGRSGPLRFVTVESRLSASGGRPALTEQQDIVYRAAAGRAVAADTAGPDPAGAAVPGPVLVREGPLRAAFRADPVALQRFSAATSNPHRIHYDHPYATSVERYPGLVVHGPLLLLSLLELIRLDLPSRQVSAVAFVARAPVFAGDPVALAGDPEGPDAIRLTAQDSAGRTAMTATVTLVSAARVRRPRAAGIGGSGGLDSAPQESTGPPR
jgi:3-methylfumaryl-CoA hydratase